MNKNIKRAFLKLAIILLTFNLVLTSLYPFFISPGVIYAQSEEDYWAADAALSAETAETQPADIPPEQPEQVDSCQTYGEGCGEPVPAPEQSEPASTCKGTPDNYNQCISCLRSQTIHQDSCGNYSVVSEQDDGACGGGWCAAEVGPSTAGAPSETAEEAAPEPTAEPVVDQSYQWADYALTDSYTQEQALDTYETRVYDAMSTQAEAEVEQRQEEDNSWDSIPETVVDTIDNTAEAVESARLQAGQAWNDFYVSKVSEDKELQKKADEAQAEVDKRDNEFAQNLAQAEDELEKKAPGYSWDNYQADNADAKQALEAVKTLGGKIEGTPTNWTFVSPESCMIDPSLCATGYEQWANTSKNEDVANFVTMGGYDIGKKALNLRSEWEELEKQRQEAGIAGVNEQGGVPQYKGYNIGDVPYDPMYAQTNNYMDAIKADLEKRSDASLTEEQKALRDKYLDGIEQFNKEGTDLTLETTAWALMNTVGGPITETVIKGGAAAVKPLVVPVVKKTGSFLEPVTNPVSKGAKAVWKKAGELLEGGAREETEQVAKKGVEQTIKEGSYILGNEDRWMVQATDNTTGEITTRLDDRELENLARARGVDTDEAFRLFSDEEEDGLVDIVRYNNYLKAQLADNPQISSAVHRLFNNPSPQNQGVVIDALGAGLNEDTLIEANNLSSDIAKYLLIKGDFSLDLSVLPSNLAPHKKEVIEAINALRYESSDVFLSGLGEVNEAELKDALVYALIKREEGLKRLKPVLEDAQDRIQAVKDFCLKYGKGTDCSTIDVAAITGENKNIYSLSSKELKGIFRYYNPKVDSGKATPLGFHMTGDGAIILGDNASVGTATHVITHECIHEACSIAIRQNAKRNLAAYFGSSRSNEADVLVEGATEFSTVLGSILKDKRVVSLQDLKQVDKNYPNQVDFLVDILIPAIKKQNSNFLKKMSDEEAVAIVAEAGLTGNYEKMIKAAGGVDKVKKLLLDNPKATETLPYKNQLSFEFTGSDSQAGFSIIPPVLAAEPVKDTAEETLMAVDRLVTPFDVAFAKKEVRKLVQNSQEENPDQVAMDSMVFSLQIKKELIKQALSENQNVSSGFVKDVVGMDILVPTVLEENNGYFLTTGETGIVEGNLAKGKYVVSVDSLPGVDIEVPAIVDLSKGDITVPIKVKQGSGQVKKVTFKKGWNLAGVVYADSAGQNKVKVVVVSDKGEVLPWAGLNIKLEKVDQEKVINLNAGWNLITLPGLPNQPLSASALLDQINAQGGEAVAVSSLEDGAWKTYVKRGDKDYSDSADNFVIEPGKAYFIKALKPVKFNFVGQNLVEPIKLKLSSGWNAVGLPKTSKSYNASGLIDGLNTKQTKADLLARWKVGLWDTFIKKNQEQYGNNFSILNTQGYILKVGKEGEFSP